jgi:hypothetical protein
VERELPSVRGPRRLIPGAPASAMVPDTEFSAIQVSRTKTFPTESASQFSRRPKPVAADETPCDPAPELVWRASTSLANNRCNVRRCLGADTGFILTLRAVPLAQGKVLEIGVCHGVNFVHDDPAQLNKVYALEPNPGMLRKAEEQRRLDIESLERPGDTANRAAPGHNYRPTGSRSFSSPPVPSSKSVTGLNLSSGGGTKRCTNPKLSLSGIGCSSIDSGQCDGRKDPSEELGRGGLFQWCEHRDQFDLASPASFGARNPVSGKRAVGR